MWIYSSATPSQDSSYSPQKRSVLVPEEAEEVPAAPERGAYGREGGLAALRGVVDGEYALHRGVVAPLARRVEAEDELPLRRGAARALRRYAGEGDSAAHGERHGGEGRGEGGELRERGARGFIAPEGAQNGRGQYAAG